MRLLTKRMRIHTVFHLKDDKLDDVIGEAVISETTNEIRLHSIFVKNAHRGKGYGEILMQAILTHSKTKLITLCTGFGNTLFFKRYGFIITDAKGSLFSMQKNP